MNLFIASGRLTKDAEIFYTQDKKAVARFDLAVNRKFKQEGQPDADFHSCVCFGKTAEIIDKCKVKKGTKLLIEGELRNNNYEKNGTKYYSSQVVVNSFEFCESKGASNDNKEETTDEAEGFIPIPDDDDELPFA